ncbi:unnamed protein product [Rhizopus stolonifer]
MYGCDYCGKLLSDLDYMTECGHIICGSKCFQNNNSCPLCKKPARLTKIGDPIPSTAGGFLKSPRRIFDDAENIISFQVSCLLSLIHYLKGKVTKQKELLEQVKEELKDTKDLKWQIYHLEQENKQLKQRLSLFNNDRHHDNISHRLTSSSSESSSYSSKSSCSCSEEEQSEGSDNLS